MRGQLKEKRKTQQLRRVLVKEYDSKDSKLTTSSNRVHKSFTKEGLTNGSKSGKINMLATQKTANKSQTVHKEFTK